MWRIPIVPQELLLKMNSNSPFTSVGQITGFVNMMNDYAFQNPNLQKFIHSTDLHFDVVINEEFFADSFLIFAHKYNAPIITMCEFWQWVNDFEVLKNHSIYLFFYFLYEGPFGITNQIDSQMGLMTPLSIAAHWVNMIHAEWYKVPIIIMKWYYRCCHTRTIWLSISDGIT